MLLKFYVFLFFSVLFSGVKSQSCTMRLEIDNSLVEENNGQASLAGDVQKDLTPADHVPGFVVEGLELQEWSNKSGCIDFFTITQENATYVAISVADGFADKVDGFSTDPSKCYLQLTWKPSACHSTPVANKVFYNIVDVNMHPPEFNKAAYKLEIAYPVGVGLPINTAASIEMKSTDKDFSTKEVTYEIEDGSNDFTIVPRTSSNKEYPFELRTKRSFSTVDTITLRIKATDDGKNPGPLSSTVEVKIIPNADSLPPVPEFSNSLYYDSSAISNSSLTEGSILPIKIENTYEGAKIEVVNNTNFEVQLDNGSKTTYVLVLKKELAEDATYAQVQLKATITNTAGKEATSYTVVVFDITYDPDDSTSTSASSTTLTTTTSTTITDSTTTEGPGSCDTDPPGEGEVDGEKDDCDGNTGLLAATIVLALTTGVLVGMVVFGYLKYVHRKPYIHPTSGNLPSTSSNNGSTATGFANLAYVDEKPESAVGGTLHPLEVKTRKRSMTFTDNDQQSRLNREANNSKSDTSQVGTEGETNSQTDQTENSHQDEEESQKITSL